MFTIKAASDLTSVPVATLRAWERRYGIALPQRTSGGYRLYDDRALEEIRAMSALVHEGWAPRQAADEVLRRRGTGVAAFDQLVASHAGLPGPEVLADAAVALDEPAMSAALDTAFRRAPFEHALEAWLTPALHLVGQAWREGRLDVSGEHVVSGAVMRKLSALYEERTALPSGPRVLVGLPAGAEHQIPALAFAISARRSGLAALYLGANVPAEAWVAAMHRSPVSAIVMSVATDQDARSANLAIDAIHAEDPDMCVAVGGVTASMVSKATLRFGAGVAESVRALRTTLDSIRK